MSAYQAEWEFEALCSELEMMPPIPRLVPMFSASRTSSGNDAEAADEHEPERQQPDEEPVGERAGDDAAGDLAVAVDHLEDRVDPTAPAARLERIESKITTSG